MSRISESFGLARNGSDIGDIVSYSWLDYLGISFIIKPIAKYMLTILRYINRITDNFGWSIVVFTVLLNMLFFPLRWKSSIAMKRAAALQPRMKDLRERMKNLEQEDPRMRDLQREQLALVKESNPLGCLPMLLQAPFLMTFYAVLVVSIEVRQRAIHGLVTRSFGARSLLVGAADDGYYDDGPEHLHIHDCGSGSKENQLRNPVHLHIVYELRSRRFGSLLDGQ